MEFDQEAIDELRSMRMICRGAVLSCLLTLFLIAVLCVSGIILAVKSRQDYPLDEAVRENAIRSFSSVAAWHNGFAMLILFPVLFLVAFSILFALYVGGFQTKCTKHPWAQTARAVGVLLVLLAGTVLGKVYFGTLQSSNHWLLPPAGGYPEGMAVAKGQVIGSGTFTTFIVFHAVIVPLVALILVGLMWPGFHEFTSEKEAEPRGKRLKLTHGQDV